MCACILETAAFADAHASTLAIQLPCFGTARTPAQPTWVRGAAHKGRPPQLAAELEGQLAAAAGAGAVLHAAERVEECG